MPLPLQTTFSAHFWWPAVIPKGADVGTVSASNVPTAFDPSAITQLVGLSIKYGVVRLFAAIDLRDLQWTHDGVDPTLDQRVAKGRGGKQHEQRSDVGGQFVQLPKMLHSHDPIIALIVR